MCCYYFYKGYFSDFCHGPSLKFVSKFFSCNSGNVLKIEKYEQNRFLCRKIAFSLCSVPRKIHGMITTFLPELIVTTISIPRVVQSIYNDKYDLVNVTSYIFWRAITTVSRDDNFSGHERNVTGILVSVFCFIIFVSGGALVVVVVISRPPHCRAL